MSMNNKHYSVLLKRVFNSTIKSTENQHIATPLWVRINGKKLPQINNINNKRKKWHIIPKEKAVTWKQSMILKSFTNETKLNNIKQYYI